MAAFLTANRWSSGVGTHKTKEGRILCTGVGCLGCFPETNRAEAEELGVFDEVDNKGHLRTFLDQDEKTTVAMQKNSNPRKSRTRSKRKIHAKEKQSLVLSKNITKRNFYDSDDEVRATTSKNDAHEMTSPRSFRTRGTQTPRLDDERMVRKYSGLSREAQKVVSSMLRGQNFPEFVEQSSSEENQLCTELERCKFKETIGHSMDNSISQHYNLTENNVKNGCVNRKVNKTAQISDSLYVIPKRDIAVNFSDNILPSEDKELYWNSWDLGENAVLLYFAIEYFRSERILPAFKVLEIVEALSEIVAANDIKCVQKVNNIWQIVLRTRKDLGGLRLRGLRIRGRVYELVEDIDSYCQTIYGDP